MSDYEFVEAARPYLDQAAARVEAERRAERAEALLRQVRGRLFNSLGDDGEPLFSYEQVDAALDLIDSSGIIDLTAQPTRKAQP